MTTVSAHAPSSFCWVELAASSASSAKKFYGEMFGWFATEGLAGPGLAHTRLTLRDEDVAGLYEMPAEMLQRGVPAHWSTYISVASADEVASKVRTLGGTLVKPPFDVLDLGRMAIVQDPTGAACCIWQAKNHGGAKLRDEPGALCWSELATRDPAAAKKFYSGLFGWEMKESAKNAAYTEVMNGGEAIGGIMTLDPAGHIPSHWMPYFAVADTEDSHARARRLGASIRVTPTDIPKVGRFAVIQDPDGAFFSIIALAPRG